MGYIMKINGDLDKMINSLDALLNNTWLMTMLIPALIGTLNVPGGAILSAPMVEKSGEKINLDPASMSTINFFSGILLSWYILFIQHLLL